MARHSSETERLLACTTQEERDAFLRGFVSRNEHRLRRMVDLRVAPRWRGRIDPAAVVHGTFREACERVDEFLGGRTARLYVWVRSIAARRLERASVSLLAGEGAPPQERDRGTLEAMARASPRSLANALLGRAFGRRPSMLELVLAGMDPIDREIILLRNFERLSNQEAAEVLEVTESTARRRYVKALRILMAALPGVTRARSGERKRGET